MVEVVTAIACTTVAIVLLTYIKDSLDGRRRAKVKGAGKESTQMQVAIDELQIECGKLGKKLPSCKNRLRNSTFSSTTRVEFAIGQQAVISIAKGNF